MCTLHLTLSHFIADGAGCLPNAMLIFIVCMAALVGKVLLSEERIAVLENAVIAEGVEVLKTPVNPVDKKGALPLLIQRNKKRSFRLKDIIHRREGMPQFDQETAGFTTGRLLIPN